MSRRPPPQIAEGKAGLMQLFAIRILRHRRWLRRVDVARAWQEAERAQAAEHSAAVRRILGQARTKQ